MILLILNTCTTTKTDALVDSTTATNIPTRPTPAETTAMSTTSSQPTEPTEPTSITTSDSVYFELKDKVYPNNSVIPLSEVGQNGDALLCKTDLVTCCGTLPNRFGEFYYPNEDTVSVKGLGHGFYRDRWFVSIEEKESLLQLVNFTVPSLMQVELYEIYTSTCSVKKPCNSE